MYCAIPVPSRGPMETTAPPLCSWPRSTPFSLLSTRRWAITAARPTPSTTTSTAAAAQIRCSRLMRDGGSVETLTDLLQIGGQRRVESPSTPVRGVVEGELVGVEERSVHGQR